MTLPRLPDWVPIALAPTQPAKGRTPATQINRVARPPRERTATVAAANTLLPVAFGRVELPGLVFAVGTISTDLVIGYAWCIGEIQEVEELWLNDAAAPVGVTVTHYTGTPTQTADANLTSAIAAYADTMRIDTPSGKRGIAYTVVRIPVDTIDAFPRARAIVKGLKVNDPRGTPTVAYSDNPALCMGAMITDPDFGLGLPVAGLGDAADWCDELIGTTDQPRARLALSIQQGRQIADWLDVLAEYAECWYVPDADGYRLIPDAPVDLESVPVVDAADIVRGSLTFEADDSSDAPSEIELRYTVPTEDGTPWRAETVISRLPGVLDGSLPRVPSSVSLEGVWRPLEAQLKADARLARTRHQVSLSWVTTDAGVAWQKGDVVTINHPARGVQVPVRILSVSQAGPGRYAVSGQLYDASHYPSDAVLPEAGGDVPVGAIAMMGENGVPEGWEVWDAADGYYLRIAGEGMAYADIGGTDAVTFNGNTGQGGAHTGSSNMTHIRTRNVGGSVAILDENSTRASHVHSVSASGTLAPLRRRNRLAIKITGVGTHMPRELLAFGLDNIQGLSRVTSFANRLLMADAANVSDGAETQTISGTTGATNDAHSHYIFTRQGEPDPANAPKSYNSHIVGGHNHTHGFNLVASANPKRHTLAVYGLDRAWPIIPGIILLFAGDPEALPTGWYLCDGANGTPDLSDRFVVMAGTGALQSLGDDTVAATAASSSVSHSHVGSALTTSEYLTQQIAHAALSHNHAIQFSQSHVLPYYVVGAIMYAPQA